MRTCSPTVSQCLVASQAGSKQGSLIKGVRGIRCGYAPEPCLRLLEERMDRSCGRADFTPPDTLSVSFSFNGQRNEGRSGDSERGRLTSRPCSYFKSLSRAPILSYFEIAMM